MAPDPDAPALGEGALGVGVLGPEPEAEEEAAAETPFGWFRGFARYGYIAPALAVASGLTFVAPPAAPPAFGWHQPLSQYKNAILPLSNYASGLTLVPPVIEEEAPPEEELTPVSADVTTAYPSTRSRFYQAYAFVPQPPPPPTLEVAVAPVSAVSPFGRTLQYQSKVYLAKPPEVGAAPVTVEKWQIQWKGPPRRLIRPIVIPAFTPKTIEVAVEPTVDQWHVQWKGPSRRLIRPVVVPSLTPKVIEVVETAGTPDTWQSRWPGAPSRPSATATQPTQVFVAAVEPTVDQWGIQWKGPLRVKVRPLVSPALTPKVIVEADNTGTVDTWLGRWQGPPRRPLARSYAPPALPEPAAAPEFEGEGTFSISALSPFGRPLYYQSKIIGLVPPEAAEVEEVTPVSADVTSAYPRLRSLFYQSLFEAYAAPVAVVTVTPDQWLPRWQGPPRRLQRLPGGSPFVPKEATIDNTPTGNGWWRPLSTPVPARNVWQTQPFYGYPYLGVDNFRPQWDWTIRWPDRAPQFWWKAKPYQPFVPREATIDNTITGIGWWRDLSTAPNKPNYVWRTQPFYGFPYEAADNTRDAWDWTIQWQGPPRYWPKKLLAQPFVPREAVLENTVTPDKWLVRWQQAVPVPPTWRTQPFYGYPYEAAFVDNTVTPDKWLRPFDQPKLKRLALPGGQPFIPRAAVEVVIGPDKWLQPLARAPKFRPPRLLAQPFVPREAVIDNTIRGIGWHRPLGIAVPARAVWWTQPFFGFPYEARPFVSLDDVDPCRTVNVGAIDRGYDVPAKVTVNVRFSEDTVTPTPKETVDVKPLDKTTDVDCK